MFGFLQRNVWARERRNKDKAIVIALYERNLGYPKNPQELVDFVKDYASCDRYWRLLLAEHTDLRGRDYDTKAIVEQRFEIEKLGMEAGYYRDARQKV